MADKQPGRHNMNEILIVTNTSKFSNSTIKKEFAKNFPLIRLTYASTTVRGKIHLEFLTEMEAREVFEKVKSKELTRLKNLTKL